MRFLFTCFSFCKTNWLNQTHLCPDSWAMVNASPSPVSSLMVQLRYLLHIPLIGAKPAETRHRISRKLAPCTRWVADSNNNFQVVYAVEKVKGGVGRPFAFFAFSSIIRTNGWRPSRAERRKVWASCGQASVQDIKRTVTGLNPSICST